MNAFFENILDSVLGNLRFKLIRKLWRLINGVRRFFILIVFSIFSLMMMTLGFFGSLAYMANQWSQKGEIHFDALLTFFTADFAVFFIFLSILLSKKTWLKASGLAKHFETL